MPFLWFSDQIFLPDYVPKVRNVWNLLCLSLWFQSFLKWRTQLLHISSLKEHILARLSCIFLCGQNPDHKEGSCVPNTQTSGVLSKVTTWHELPIKCKVLPVVILPNAMIGLYDEFSAFLGIGLKIVCNILQYTGSNFSWSSLSNCFIP